MTTCFFPDFSVLQWLSRRVGILFYALTVLKTYFSPSFAGLKSNIYEPFKNHYKEKICNTVFNLFFFIFFYENVIFQQKCSNQRHVFRNRTKISSEKLRSNFLVYWKFVWNISLFRGEILFQKNTITLCIISVYKNSISLVRKTSILLNSYCNE